MRWKKYYEYHAKNFEIIQKCTVEEKKTYGVDFKVLYNAIFAIRVCKLEDGSAIYQNIYCVSNDYSNDYNRIDKIIGDDHYFKSLRKAKKFVENKVKEYNKKND